MSLETRFWRHGSTKGNRTCPAAASRTPSRTYTARVSSHSFSCRQNFDFTGAVVCDSRRAATCALAQVLLKDQKANATLIILNLCFNRVGDAGAATLADALKATVLTSKKCVFRACVRCHCRCRFTKSSAEWASSTFLAGCVLVFV